LDTFRLVIAGVGGQGTLLASRLLADTAIDAGLSVKIGETYGMAQRGGPVMGHLQMGGEILNPQIRKGEADVLLGFEPVEAIRRGVTYLKENGLALVNTRIIPPVEVISGLVKYPELDRLFNSLEKISENIIRFDATTLAEEAGDPIATNIVMLGALSESGKLPFEGDGIIKVLKRRLRPRYFELNMKAFELGKLVYKDSKNSNY
jgi:indolepyruvate ferredoxin oxidoreductase beta subunit